MCVFVFILQISIKTHCVCMESRIKLPFQTLEGFSTQLRATALLVFKRVIFGGAWVVQSDANLTLGLVQIVISVL